MKKTRTIAKATAAEALIDTDPALASRPTNDCPDSIITSSLPLNPLWHDLSSAKPVT